MSTFHTPVMLGETISYLNIKKDCWYIDGTLGGGGHTQAILQVKGKVLGVDLDPDALQEVAKRHNLEMRRVNDHLQAVSDRLILCQSNFSDLKKVVEEFNLPVVCGILFDLGVSTHQLETPDRGFGFNLEALLDMRMDPICPMATAADLVNGLHEKELTELFRKYGEERFARPIARKIVEYRQKKKIKTTNELAEIILSVRPRSKKDRTHPATRVFQALRIATNDELNSLRVALPQAVEILNPGGRLVIISFHSLEDRIVKNFFKEQEQRGILKILTKKPVTPTEKETTVNPKSHSGKLRAVEKI